MSSDTRHISFPEPSREPREVTVARQRVTLHIAAGIKKCIVLHQENQETIIYENYTIIWQ